MAGQVSDFWGSRLIHAAGMQRAIAIYLERHPETALAEATAALTGFDARTIRRDAERGEKIIDEVMNPIG